MAPIFEDGNNKKDPPREEDLFETHSPGTRSLPGKEPDLERNQGA